MINAVCCLNKYAMYPIYYRKGPVCIKRETSTSGKQVNLDENNDDKPFSIVTSSDKKSFDHIVESMEIVSFETYERYLILLHKKAQQEARTFRELHRTTPEFLNANPRRYFEEY